jgi:hypothetical protein
MPEPVSELHSGVQPTLPPSRRRALMNEEENPAAEPRPARKRGAFLPFLLCVAVSLGAALYTSYGSSRGNRDGQGLGWTRVKRRER